MIANAVLPSVIRRDLLRLALLAGVVAVLLVLAIQQPGYTDAYYYFNAAQRLATGHGLTDSALWTYIAAPPGSGLPIPSHLYWMPLASLVQSASMALLGPTFRAAQIPMALCYVGLVLFAYGIGLRLGGTRRAAWLAALLTLFSGFYMGYWTTTDTFSLYGLVGAGALACIALARECGNLRWYAAAGALCALAHLTRADGVLLLAVLLMIALWPRPQSQPQVRSQPHSRSQFRGAGVALVAYLLVMSPWFIRNVNAVGTALPVGGFQTAYMRAYDEIANYPPGVSFSDFVNWGAGNILRSRWDALAGELGTLWTWIAVEGMIVVLPLALVAAWKRRRDAFLAPFALYAVGLHIAMTFVFALPGPRGGLFHSAAALLPFWMALGAVGLDDVVTWAAKRRRWPRKQALNVFSVALVVIAAGLSGVLLLASMARNNGGTFYREISARLPANAVVMVNDPPAFAYLTGRSAVVLPNAGPDIIPELMRRYGVTHIIVDWNRTTPMDPLYSPSYASPIIRLIQTDRDTKDRPIYIYEVQK